jgi:hypothetical protein
MKIGSILGGGLKSKIGGKKPRYKTFEQICLDKLKELGPSSMKKWARSLGYSNSNGIEKIVKRIQVSTPERLRVRYNVRPRTYEAL